MNSCRILEVSGILDSCLIIFIYRYPNQGPENKWKPFRVLGLGITFKDEMLKLDSYTLHLSDS